MEVLEGLKKELTEKYPNVQVEVAKLDVNKWETIKPVFLELKEKLGKIHVVIANAGVSSNGRVGTGNLANHIECINTNLIGAMATIDCGVEYFREVGSGTVVGMSSMMSSKAVPRLSAYSATKAGLDHYLESLRIELYGTKISVVTINPGFIETDMTTSVPLSKFPVTKAASIMRKSIEKKVKQLCVPYWPYILVRFFAFLIPDWLFARVTMGTNKKKNQ